MNSSVTPRYLEVEEVSRYFRESLRYGNGFFLLGAISLYTGARLTEAQLVKWEDVDENRIWFRDEKIEKGRFVPLDPKLSELLREFGDHTNNFICGDVADWDRSRVSVYATRAFQRAKIKDASFNTLRDTFASHHIINGTSIIALSKMLGHSDLRMIVKYIQLDEKDFQGAVETLDFGDIEKAISEG